MMFATMHKKFFYFFSLLLFFACKSMSFQAHIPQRIQATTLQLLGDHIQYTLQIDIPASVIKKNYVYTFEPIFCYGKNEVVTLDTIDISIKDSSKDYHTEKAYHFPYKTGMREGILKVKWCVKNKKGKTIQEDIVFLQKGVMTTAQLVKVPQTVIFHNIEVNETATQTLHTRFFFDKGQSSIRAVDMKNFKKDLQSIQKHTIKQICIQGSHSPEGPSVLNETLVNHRIVNTKQWLEKYFQKKNIDYKTTVLYNDWTLMQKQLKLCKNMSTVDQESLAAIIANSNMSFEGKQKKIQSLPFYETIQNTVYPTLRNTDIVIQYIPVSKTDAMIEDIAKKYLQEEKKSISLTVEEWQKAGFLAKDDLLLKEKCFEKVASLQGDDMSYCNLGNVYLEMIFKQQHTAKDLTWLYTKAKDCFVLALEKNTDNAWAYLQLAVIDHMQKDFSAMKAHLNQLAALTQGSLEELPIVHVCIPLCIQIGAIAIAKDFLAKAAVNAHTSYHSALVNILQNNYTQAKEDLQKCSTLADDDHTTHYLKAMVAAHTNDIEQLTLHLQAVAQSTVKDSNPFFDITKDQAFKNYPEIIMHVNQK